MLQIWRKHKYFNKNSIAQLQMEKLCDICYTKPSVRKIPKNSISWCFVLKELKIFKFCYIYILATNQKSQNYFVYEDLEKCKINRNFLSLDFHVLIYCCKDKEKENERTKKLGFIILLKKKFPSVHLSGNDYHGIINSFVFYFINSKLFKFCYNKLSLEYHP